MSALTRWLPASGLLAAGALALTGLISPPPPGAGAVATDIVAYYSRHRVGLELESIADGVGIILLVVFAATFHAWIRTGLSMTAYVAAAIIAACTLVQVAAFHALAFRPDPEPMRAALLNDLQSFTFQVTTFPTLLFLGAGGAAILVSSRLPRWLGIAAIVAAGLQVVSWISFFCAFWHPGGRRSPRHRVVQFHAGVAGRVLNRNAGSIQRIQRAPGVSLKRSV